MNDFEEMEMLKRFKKMFLKNKKWLNNEKQRSLADHLNIYNIK